MIAEYNGADDDIVRWQSADGKVKTAHINDLISAYEPKKGKWIDLRSDGRFGKETRCSQCGEIYWEWMSKFDYCPNCGAKMDGKEQKGEIK